jgi:hypothetical protein
MAMKKRYGYYIVEGIYLVRWGTKVCEYLKPDGTWHDYPDEWDVMTNGRRIGDDEEQAMEKAKALFAKLEKYGFKYPD